jgi:uncharacterized membrane protein YgdD (TMEM256/DUF423 family)
MWLVIGSLSGLAAVALGALGKHAILSDEFATSYETAVRYQFYHSFAFLTLGLLTVRVRSLSTHLAGLALLGGMLLFCGSLYGQAFSGVRALTYLAPVGGVLFMVGWFLLAWVSVRHALALRLQRRRAT